MGISRRIISRGALPAMLTAALAVALSGCAHDGMPSASASAPAGASAQPSRYQTAAARAATPAGTSTVAPGAAAVAPCAARGTGAKSTGTRMSPAELYLVRAGRHTCYDRLVLDVDGAAAVGARSVRPRVLSDGAGRAVKVSGRAALQIVVRAPTGRGIERAPALPEDPASDAGWYRPAPWAASR